MASPKQTTNRRGAAVAMACALACTAASPARAQQPPGPTSAPPASPGGPADPQIAEARDAFRIGSTLAKQAQWVDALAAFERSARLRPHAVTTYNIAFCERALGRYARARKSFARAIAAPGGELPQALATESRGYLAEIEQRLVRAVITLTRPGAALAVDGRPLESAGGAPAHPTLVAGTRGPGPAEAVKAASFDLLLDPGTHVLLVSASGAPDAVVTRDFAPGTTPALTLGPTSGPVKLADATTRAGAGPGRRAGAAVAFGLGGAGLVVGAVMGGLALHQRSSLDAQCPTKSNCPASAQGTIDSMNHLASGSTIGFGVLVAGAGLGAVLLLTGTGGAKAAPARGATATPWIGPGSLGVRGAF
jgi:hypothetical protein